MYYLQEEFLDNTLQQWGTFMLLIIAAYLLKKYMSIAMSAITYKLFRKFSTENEAKTFYALLSKPFESFILFATIYYAFKSLHYPSILELGNEDLDLKILVNQILKTFGAIVITRILLRIVDFFSFIFYNKYSDNDSRVDKQIVPFVKDSIKVVVCIISMIFILGVIFHLNVASILAGIGIGGLALALAAKESLENLFGSFTIFIDRPFSVGDIVKVGNYTGTVERVGFRSTRIRTDNKTFVTVPNKQIVDSFLDNLTERTHRRVEFKLYLNLESNLGDVQAFIISINNFLTSVPLIALESTAYFHQLTKFAIEIQIAYLVEPCEANEFNQIRQTVNLQILELIQKGPIKVAVYPAFPIAEKEEIH